MGFNTRGRSSLSVSTNSTLSRVSKPPTTLLMEELIECNKTHFPKTVCFLFNWGHGLKVMKLWVLIIKMPNLTIGICSCWDPSWPSIRRRGHRVLNCHETRQEMGHPRRSHRQVQSLRDPHLGADYSNRKVNPLTIKCLITRWNVVSLYTPDSHNLIKFSQVFGTKLQWSSIFKFP